MVMQLERGRDIDGLSFDETPSWKRLVQAFLSHAKAVPELLSAHMEAFPEDSNAFAAKALFLSLLARRELQAASRMAAFDARARWLRCDRNGPAELAYVEAAEHAAEGALALAADRLERRLRIKPQDALAVKLVHAFRFMLGDRARMLESIECALPRLDPHHPHRGYLFGCKAFALEEGGDFAQAPGWAETGLAINPDDAWGMHAISHVHEMTGKAAEGAAWIEARRADFAHCNTFRGHLFWHLALFRIETGPLEAVLDLYDQEVRAEFTDDFRDIANAASLLMRIELEGGRVGRRW